MPILERLCRFFQLVAHSFEHTTKIYGRMRGKTLQIFSLKIYAFFLFKKTRDFIILKKKNTIRNFFRNLVLFNMIFDHFHVIIQ